MSTETLEPTLTAFDKRVLSHLPKFSGYRSFPEKGITVWQLAEALNIYEVSELLAILWGFQHLGYIEGTVPRLGKRTRWWRTPKGDEAVGA